MKELFQKVRFPERIICLTEETTEILYLLGEGHRVVGISGYTVRPPEARAKPKVCAYITAKFDKIYSLKPDLIFAFSDLQADIVRELVKQGLNVVTFNQRSVNEILSMILSVGALIGCLEKAQKLVASLQADLDAIFELGQALPKRPKVFFEEWKDPLISGIRWVSELIEIAGGEDIFPELRNCQSGSERIVTADEVAKRNPDVIIASWCGRKVEKRFIRNRHAFAEVKAVQNNQIYEIKSTYILQPGPASLTDGVKQLKEIIRQVAMAD
ncbi:MAG: cobalamin-binding protein [Blastocatellia bacterium]|nr:cobalamin-binding protein [Blastocatellia bacterium]MBL8193640.1 cobalamin-binding protein [Blastocatellia bacterium]MBN8723748.1 cobalamin-binding protein [Acidobacteriota bacterium]